MSATNPSTGIQLAKAVDPSTFNSSPEAFGLRGSASPDVSARNAESLKAVALANAFAAFGLDASAAQRILSSTQSKSQSAPKPLQPASGANTIPLGPRKANSGHDRPPPSEIPIPQPSAAVLPFPLTPPGAVVQTQPSWLNIPIPFAPTAFASPESAPPAVPQSAFITNPNALKPVRASAFPAMRGSATDGEQSALNNAPAPSAFASPAGNASAFALMNPFATNGGAFPTDNTFYPDPASALGCPNAWPVLSTHDDDDAMDVDDPNAMDICYLVDSDAMDTSPDRDFCYDPRTFAFDPRAFLPPQFLRVFQPFVPPPPPAPSRTNAYNFLRLYDSTAAAINALPARPDICTLPPRPRCVAVETSAAFSPPIMDELIRRHPNSPEAILAPKKPARRTASEKKERVRQNQYWAARCARSKAERREPHEQLVEMARQPVRPAPPPRSEPKLERIAVPPCMVPEKTKKTLARMAPQAEQKAAVKTGLSSRKCGLAKVASSLLSTTCAAPKAFFGLL
ncbi:hypothetical protein HDZ31DRAFT_76443 [Schizophyllum fasciatum]